MTQEQGRLRLDFMSATKDAGALNRQLLDKDDDVRRLRVALQEANSALSMSSWQHVNSPDDTEKHKLKGAVEEWQNTCKFMERTNSSP